MTRMLIVSLIALLLSASPLFADGPARTHDIVPEDYFTIAVPTACAASPDGKYLAYSEMRWDEAKDGRNTDIWLVELKTKETRRLTFDPARDGSLAWGADSRHVYFTSRRKRAGEEKPPLTGDTQVWRVSVTGGSPQAVTRIEGGIRGYDLAADGTALYYTVSKETFDDDAFKATRKEYKHLEYGHGVVEYSQLWKLDLSSWRAAKLIEEDRVIQEFKVSPDESRIAMRTTPDDNLITNEGWSRIDAYDASSKTVSVVSKDGWRDNHPSPYGWLEGLAWAGDNQALAFTIAYDGYPSELYVAEWIDDGVGVAKLDRPDEVDIAGPRLKWRGKTRDLCFLGESHARQWVYSLPGIRHGQHGAIKQLTPEDVVVGSFDFDRSGQSLYTAHSTTTHPADLFHYRFDSSAVGPQRVTKLNPQVDTWKLPQISVVKWKGADGDEVEGILELPPHYRKSDGPLPMIVELHGGPTASTKYQFRLWIYGRALMPSKGYALLSPNYHGSTGYGREFMCKLIGRENEIEVKDILSGVEAMVDSGIADADKLGVMGWSNGGYLTNCVITQSDRFKAASSGAGVLDMVIQWGGEDTPGHVVNYTQGLPWTKPDAYRHSSPVYGLGNVKTPTLIHVGGNDPRCPPAHSRALYRALRFYVDVPVELVVYPGEPHGLGKYKNRKAKMYWDLAWFDRYIMGKVTHEKGGHSEEDVRVGLHD